MSHAMHIAFYKELTLQVNEYLLRDECVQNHIKDLR